MKIATYRVATAVSATLHRHAAPWWGCMLKLVLVSSQHPSLPCLPTIVLEPLNLKANYDPHAEFGGRRRHLCCRDSSVDALNAILWASSDT